MLRMLLAVVAGVIVGGVVVALVEGAGHIVFPPPEGTNLKDPEALKAIMQDIPFGAKIAVLVAWALGVFVGGAVAKVISKNTVSIWIVAGVFGVFTAATLMQIPHPIWMIAGAVFAIFAGAFAAKTMIKSQ